MNGPLARSTCPHRVWESDAFDENDKPVGRVCLDCGLSQQWYAHAALWGPVIHANTWSYVQQPLPFPDPGATDAPAEDAKP